MGANKSKCKEEELKIETIKLLVIGQTGSGKSTFINTLFNHIQGKKFNEKKDFIIPCIEQPNCTVPEFVNPKKTENLSPSTESQTRECTTYHIVGEKYDLYVIDTPGLGDTRGKEQDKINTMKIINGINKHAEFNAICLCVKGSDNRINESLKYYISQIRKMLTQDCKDNFIICFSFVAKKVAHALDALVAMGIPANYMFKFDNSCLFEEENGPMEEMLWLANKKEFEALFEQAAKLPLYSSETIQKLHEARLAYEEEISKQSGIYNDIITKGRYIMKYKALLETSNLEMDKNKEYKNGRKKYKLYREKLAPGEYNVECDLCNDKTVCCANCSVSPIILDNKGSLTLFSCGTIKLLGGHCKQCGCNYKRHTLVDTVLKKKVWYEVNSKMKAVFENASDKKKYVENELKEINKELEANEVIRQESLNKIVKAVQSIKENSLEPFEDYYHNWLLESLNKGTERQQKEAIQRFEDYCKLKA